MSKSGFLALLAAGIFATCTAQAQQQPWIVKGGVGYMMPKSNPGNVDFDDGKVAVDFDDAWARHLQRRVHVRRALGRRDVLRHAVPDRPHVQGRRRGRSRRVAADVQRALLFQSERTLAAVPRRRHQLHRVLRREAEPAASRRIHRPGCDRRHRLPVHQALVRYARPALDLRRHRGPGERQPA